MMIEEDLGQVDNKTVEAIKIVESVLVDKYPEDLLQQIVTKHGVNKLYSMLLTLTSNKLYEDSSGSYIARGFYDITEALFFSYIEAHYLSNDKEEVDSIISKLIDEVYEHINKSGKETGISTWNEAVFRNALFNANHKFTASFGQGYFGDEMSNALKELSIKIFIKQPDSKNRDPKINIFNIKNFIKDRNEARKNNASMSFYKNIITHNLDSFLPF